MSGLDIAQDPVLVMISLGVIRDTALRDRTGGTRLPKLADVGHGAPPMTRRAGGEVQEEVAGKIPLLTASMSQARSQPNAMTATR